LDTSSYLFICIINQPFLILLVTHCPVIHQFKEELKSNISLTFQEPHQKDKEVEDEVIKTDLSKLSKRQKLTLLQKESPEFFGLVEDFKGKVCV